MFDAVSSGENSTVKVICGLFFFHVLSGSRVCLSAPFWHPANTPSSAVAESTMLGGSWCCVAPHRAAGPSVLAQGSALILSWRCSCCWHGCFPERDGRLRLPRVHPSAPLRRCWRPRGRRSSRPCSGAGAARGELRARSSPVRVGAAGGTRAPAQGSPRGAVRSCERSLQAFVCSSERCFPLASADRISARRFVLTRCPHSR